MICLSEQADFVVVQKDGEMFKVGPGDPERTISLNDDWGVHVFKWQKARPLKLNAQACGESLIYG